jgi:hypothetical protein
MFQSVISIASKTIRRVKNVLHGIETSMRFAVRNGRASRVDAFDGEVLDDERPAPEVDRQPPDVHRTLEVVRTGGLGSRRAAPDQDRP